MRWSLRAAEATIKNHQAADTTWVGPIQGGIFGDLVRASAKGLVRAGFQVLALGSPVELMEGYRFSELQEMIVNARKSIPFSMPLHLFGAGHPLMLPLSVALGCDTFDSASYMLYAKKDRYMTERGTLQLERMAYLPCSCPECNATSLSELRTLPREERVRKIALHNLHVLRADVLRCKEAICEGRLWDLVEERAMAHTSLQRAFRLLARNHSEWLAKPTPLLKSRGLMIRSEEDRGEARTAACQEPPGQAQSGKEPQRFSARRKTKAPGDPGGRRRRAAVDEDICQDPPIRRLHKGRHLQDKPPVGGLPPGARARLPLRSDHRRGGRPRVVSRGLRGEAEGHGVHGNRGHRCQSRESPSERETSEKEAEHKRGA